MQHQPSLRDLARPYRNPDRRGMVAEVLADDRVGSRRQIPEHELTLAVRRLLPVQLQQPHERRADRAAR
jgi:hypothetical protein